MERISAACAMEWSIELEKALRSKIPGRSIEAIIQIGQRLQQWSREPEPTMAVYNMFGLVPGEDRLFANSVLLRLADAFSLGNKETRLSVVQVFFELQNHDKKRKRKSKSYKGILSKARVHNHLELLKRVKTVFDTGDVESRALALVLLGFWADFAKDSAHIRYLILSSLVSSDIVEVKASLFAAGCFCELASDFAAVVLEMLLNIVASFETILTVRLAGARVFAKMGCSYAIANRAYKSGLKLVLDSSEEEFLVAMLVSLSKLASKSTFLLLEQVDVLLSFLNQEKNLRLQATALRCLHCIFERVCFPPISSHLVKTLLRIADETKLPSAMQCGALQLLHKILLCRLPNLLCDNMLEFAHVINILETSTKSAIMSKSLIAIRVLVDISTKLGGRTELDSAGDYSFTLLMQIISIIVDWIISLVKPLLDCYHNSAGVLKEVKSLLNLLLFLVGKHPDLSLYVLDKIRSVIEYVVERHNTVMASRQAGLSVHEIVDFRREKSLSFSLKLVYIVHRFSVSCIENLIKLGAFSTQVLDKLKLLVKCVHHCKLFGGYAHIMYSILLHSHILWGCALNKNKETCNLDENLGSLLCIDLVEHEIFSLECAKSMLLEKDTWPAYKAGMWAAYQGAWITSTFLFELLESKVQSQTFCYWLKSLAQFAHSEGKILLFLLQKTQSSLAHGSQMKDFLITLSGNNFDEVDQGNVKNTKETNYIEVLSEAHRGLRSSEETLRSIVTMIESFCFQRWFLSLRSKVLGNAVDILEVLATIPLNLDNATNNNLDNTTNNRQVEEGGMVEWLNSLQKFIQISFQLKRLAQEFDLIATSFIGMDVKSSKIISALAFSCSLLAFTAGFPLFISRLPEYEILTGGQESSKNCLQGMLIQNLVGRLWHIDQKTCSKLCLLLEVNGDAKDGFHLQPKYQIQNISGEYKDVLSICSYAVSGLVDLQHEGKIVHDKEKFAKIAKDGSQLLLNAITKWTHIPFQVPKYFFKVRPTIGSELFALCVDSENQIELSVLPGFQLSLSLCLKLRNLPPDLPIHVAKLYCILCYSKSFQEKRPSGETNEQTQLDYQGWDTQNVVQMNEKLLQYVTENMEKACTGKHRRINDDRIVNSFVHFEVNDRGQGFSNCLLDVSHFPVGSYRIKWHSCCIDSQGSYWSFLPLNAGPVFTVKNPTVAG